MTGTGGAPGAEADRLRAELRRLQAQAGQAPEVAEELERTRAQLAESQAELERLRGSSSFQLGQLFVSSARDPRHGVVRLPRELVRMWRRRGSPRPAQLARQATAATARTAPAPDAATGDPAELLVDHVRWAPVRPGRPVVGIVAGPAEPADAATGTGAYLVRLVPDRYRAVLGSLDLVVVLASAGSAGAWSGLGGGGAVERDRELGDLLGRCGGHGVASVVLFDIAREQVPVLADLAALADLALDPESAPELTPAARLGDPDGWLAAVLARAAGTATTTEEPKEPDAAT